MPRKPPDDIVSKTKWDNETWNSCPECGKSWKDKKAILGLLHRTRLCAKCYPKVKARYEKI